MFKIFKISLLLLMLCFFGSRSGRADAETRDAVRNETVGEWSQVVDGVRGRLVMGEDAPLNGTRMLVASIELQNVSDVGDPLEIYFTTHNFLGVVLDRKADIVPATGGTFDMIMPFDYWLVLPFDSSLRFRVSVNGYGIPKDSGALLWLVQDVWVMKKDERAPYFLRGTFTGLKSGEKAKREWVGVLELPPVQMPEAVKGAG